VNGVVEPLSYDHKPNNELETKRIEAAGGWVMFNRVNGNLALSRALGDYIFKKNDQKKLDEQIVIGKNNCIICIIINKSWFCSYFNYLKII
jgi:protein phosphatase 2C family protein 2/3